MVHQQILQQLLVRAVLNISTVLDLTAERCPELLIILALILLHLEQLTLDLLLKALRNGLQMAVVLQHFTGDVERQICRIDHAVYKAEMIGQQIRAFVHDEYAVGVQLQTLLIVLGVVVHRRVRRDEQHCRVRYRAFHTGMDVAQRRLIIVELLRIEAVVILVLQLLLGLLPDRNHGIEGLILGVLLPLRLVVVTCIRRLLLHAGARHIHLDRIANIIGILLYQTLNAVRLEKFIVILVLRIILDGQHDLRAVFRLFARCNRVAVRTVGLPAVGLVAACRTGYDLNMLCDHKCRIEANAELTDDVDVVLLFVFVLERQRTGMRDRTEVVLHFLGSHAAAVVLDDKAAVCLVERQLNWQAVAGDTGLAFLHCIIVELIRCVGCVGDQLTQKDFLVRINGVDHQIEQALGFCLKLLGCHDYIHLCVCCLVLALSITECQY